MVEREMVVRNGVILRKYFLDVSQDEQRRRFEARIEDPVKHWKLSPMDTESVRRWWDYTAAYQSMIRATHTPDAPWYIVPSDNKRRARLNLIRHLLDSIPNKKVDMDLPKIPKAQPRPKNATEGLGAARRSPVTTEEGIALGAHDCSTPGASPAARPNRPMPPPFHMPVAARR
jgi:polyphosphate kinase